MCRIIHSSCKIGIFFDKFSKNVNLIYLIFNNYYVNVNVFKVKITFVNDFYKFIKNLNDIKIFTDYY